MSICDKIQTVGETMETNLNARGVSCTFGTGTGEKNILQMANLITATNLKGSADSIISISASRPYLLSGEKTDLIVKLTNGLGEPKANASVTVSDGTSVYSGITNIAGFFVLYDLTISADTTFTATYSSVSDTCKVECVYFVDYGISTNKNDTWDTWGSYAVTRTRNDGYTLVEQATSGTRGVQMKYINNMANPTVIEFDALVQGGANNTIVFQLRGNNQSVIKQCSCSSWSGGAINTWYHYKIDLTNKVWYNQTLNKSVTFDTGTISFMFYIDASASHKVQYKNFTIY